MLAAFDEVIAYAERRTREALRAAARRPYEAEGELEGDGVSEDDMPIRVAVTIAGDAIEIDFAGTAPAAAGNVNARSPSRARPACSRWGRARRRRPGQRRRSTRAVEIRAPEGSLVDARSAVGGRRRQRRDEPADRRHRAAALAQAVDVPAQGQGTMNNVVIGGAGWTYYETIGGGQGASSRGAGPSGVHVGMTNTLNTPIEALELEFPMRVERYELRDGSGGERRHRGGDGIVREIRVLEPATLSLLTDRRRHAPQGLDGGGPGRPGQNLLNGERAAAEATRELAPGDVVTVRRRAAAAVGKNRAMNRWVGQSIPRREDLPLLTGRGQFVDDVPVANPLHVAFARSPWAHAEIHSVDLAEALAAPGVAAGLSGTELLPDLTDPFAAGITHRLAFYAMAVERARYAGEPVAVVAAESRYLAEDAAELVAVEYEPLEAVVTVEDALDPTKPVLHEQVGSNVVVDRTLRYGDPDCSVRPGRPRCHRDAALGALQLDAGRDLRRSSPTTSPRRAS